MSERFKKFIPLMILGGIVLFGVGIYILVNRTGMPMKTSTDVAGFWLGLWQGAIVCLSFIASIFDKNIVLYQAANSGLTYNLGFLLGLCISIGAGASSSKKKNKK